jgi:hypothetical protein
LSTVLFVFLTDTIKGKLLGCNNKFII